MRKGLVLGMLAQEFEELLSLDIGWIGNGNSSSLANDLLGGIGSHKSIKATRLPARTTGTTRGKRHRQALILSGT